MMLPMSENGIFWNVYEQECRFRQRDARPPRFVRTTCDKLAALYPALEDAEMFMRAQFVMGIEGIDYSLRKLVFAFKDFIMDRHQQAYREYKRWHSDIVQTEIQVALNQIKDVKFRNDFFELWIKNSTSPLVRYLVEGCDCPQEYQEQIAIKCLHYPYLVKRLILSDYLKKRIQSYKDEVRATERQDSYSGNSKYQLIDLSEI